MIMHAFAISGPLKRAMAIGWSVLLWLLASAASAATGLTDLQFASLPGGQVEIKLAFDGQPPETKYLEYLS